MRRKITNAVGWRLALLEKRLYKVKWNLKNVFDFRAKEKVNSVSVIVVGRNDNYGGDFSKRLRTTMDWNLAHLPNPELIYVEWNQVKDRPSDCEWITARYPNATCYVVPESIHRSIAADPVRMPVMEYFGKNIGIRKAKSDWILLVNADVVLAPDTIRNLPMLNKDTIYGTHYVSFRWDQEPISESHFKDEGLVTFAFSVEKGINAVAGNFILTHKKNWIKATGYDERLNNIRAWVDSIGVSQLVSLGMKTRVLGHHFHLDHPESIVNASNETHGVWDAAKIKGIVPYRNTDDWGLINYPLIQTADRIWELQKI